MLQSDVAPKMTDVGNNDPLGVRHETVLDLKLLSEHEDDFRYDLRG